MPLFQHLFGFQYYMRRAVGIDLPIHDHLNSFVEADLYYIQVLVFIEALTGDFYCIFCKEEVHLVGEFGGALPGVAKVGPVLRCVAGFLKEFALCGVERFLALVDHAGRAFYYCLLTGILI